MARLIPSGRVFAETTQRAPVRYAQRPEFNPGAISAILQLAEQVGGSKLVGGILNVAGKGIGAGASAIGQLGGEREAPEDLQREAARKMLTEKSIGAPAPDRSPLTPVEFPEAPIAPPDVDAPQDPRQFIRSGFEQGLQPQQIRASLGGVYPQAQVDALISEVLESAEPKVPEQRVIPTAEELIDEAVRKRIIERTPQVAPININIGEQKKSVGAPGDISELKGPAPSARQLPPFDPERLKQLVDLQISKGASRESVTQTLQQYGFPQEEIDYVMPAPNAVSVPLEPETELRQRTAEEEPAPEVVELRPENVAAQKRADALAEIAYAPEQEAVQEFEGLEGPSESQLFEMARNAQSLEEQGRVLRLSAETAEPETLLDIISGGHKLRRAKEIKELFPKEFAPQSEGLEEFRLATAAKRRAELEAGLPEAEVEKMRSLSANYDAKIAKMQDELEHGNEIREQRLQKLNTEISKITSTKELNETRARILKDMQPLKRQELEARIQKLVSDAGPDPKVRVSALRGALNAAQDRRNELLHAWTKAKLVKDAPEPDWGDFKIADEGKAKAKYRQDVVAAKKAFEGIDGLDALLTEAEKEVARISLELQGVQLGAAATPAAEPKEQITQPRQPAPTEPVKVKPPAVKSATEEIDELLKGGK